MGCVFPIVVVYSASSGIGRNYHSEVAKWHLSQSSLRYLSFQELSLLSGFYLRVFSWPTCKKDRNFRASIQCQRKRARFCQWLVQRISSRRLEYWFRLLLFHDLQSYEWSEIISQSKSLGGFLVSLHDEAIETDLSAPQRVPIRQVTLWRYDFFNVAESQCYQVPL